MKYYRIIGLRWLCVLVDSDVLASETNALPKAESRQNTNHITLLCSADGDDQPLRRVSATVDKQGALLVADDAGNTVWRVSCHDCQ